MKVYKLNMKFNSVEECRKWEDENLSVDGRQMYNGEYIMMVMHDEVGDEVTLTEIWTV